MVVLKFLRRIFFRDPNVSEGTEAVAYGNRAIVCTLIVGVIIGAAPSMSAQDQMISQMVHTAWTGRDGAPQGITGLAQTSDGTLWIGSVGGLYSFDGLAFAPFEAKPGSPALNARTIESLFVSNTGDLWVFGYRGGPSRIRNGVVTTFNRSDDEPLSTVEFPQQDKNGVMWAVANGQQLVRLGEDSVWHNVANPTDTGEISALFMDSSDTFWVMQNDSLYQKSKKDLTFRSTRVRAHGPAQISEGSDHSLWIVGILNHSPDRGMRVSTLQHVDRWGKLLPSVRPAHEVNSLVVALDGSIWASEEDRIVERFVLTSVPSGAVAPSGPSSDTYAINNGKTIASRVLWRDADGNIWIGGLEGLDRFKRSTLVTALPAAQAGVWFSCVDGRDNIWLGNPTTPLRRLSQGRVSVVTNNKGVDDLHCGPAEGVWFSAIDRLSTVVDGIAHPLPKIPSERRYAGPHYVLGFSVIDDHALIAVVRGARGNSLWLYENGVWRPFQPEGSHVEVTGISQAISGGVYLGHPGGLIEMFGDKPLRLLRTFTSNLGTISGFSRTSYGLLAYGSDGIGLIMEGGVHHLRFSHPESSVAVTGAAEAGNGEIWLNGRRGIVRISSSEVRAALGDASHQIDSTNVHEADFTGPSLPAYNNATVNADSRGTLWISTLHGVVHVDPTRIPTSNTPPKLAIRSISGDSHILAVSRALPPGTHMISMQYFGIDLARPESVRYRYKLVGYDSVWQEVGQQTTATYTRLRPGRYVFQVMASTGSTWSGPVASETFTILPYYYQTVWFALLCVTALALLTWILITLRIRFVGNVIRMRAEERAEERIRIARDLHDTLLQGVQGLQLSFHVAAQEVPPNSPLKESLDRVLTLADRLILEGRTRVAQLRSDFSTNEDLLKALEQTIADLSRVTKGVQCRFIQRSSAHVLRRDLSSEVYLIARESLTNAFRHAAASLILLELEYGDRQFVMRCQDDGAGFDTRGAQTQRAGQWGLRGMSERAERIGGRLTLESMAGSGTQITLIIPAHNAYPNVSRLAFTIARIFRKEEPGSSQRKLPGSNPRI